MPSLIDKDVARAAIKRSDQVIQANANMALEGFQPDQSDMEIQAEYLAGTATTEDLLAHAHDFVASIHRSSPKG